MTEPEKNERDAVNDNTQKRIREDAEVAAERARAREEASAGIEHGKQYEHEEREFPPEKPPRRFTVPKLLKYLALALIAFVFTFLIVRIFLQNDTGYAFSKQFIWNEKTVEAYNANSESFSAWSQNLVSYDITLETAHDDVPAETYHKIHSDFGGIDSYENCFKEIDFVYIEASRQAIVTLRVNNSAKKQIAALFDEKEFSKQMLCFTLSDRNLTPDSSKNDDYYETADFITECEYLYDTRSTYSYYRILFDGVNIADHGELFLNIYPAMDGVTLAKPTALVQIYDVNIYVDALDTENLLPAKPTEGLTDGSVKIAG